REPCREVFADIVAQLGQRRAGKRHQANPSATPATWRAVTVFLSDDGARPVTQNRSDPSGAGVVSTPNPSAADVCAFCGCATAMGGSSCTTVPLGCPVLPPLRIDSTVAVGF